MYLVTSNKISRYSPLANSEDYLTACVFGYLKVFSEKDILRKFLSRAKNLAGELLDPAIIVGKSIQFWNKYYLNRRYHEPDIVIEAENEVYVIECKYRSVLSEEGDPNQDATYTNQLIRYYFATARHYSRSTTVIFLTNDNRFPTEVLRRSQEKVPTPIYWLAWRDLHSVLSKEIDNGFKSHTESALAKDLRNFLECLSMDTFNGIRKPQVFSIEWTYSVEDYFQDLITEPFEWKFYQMYFSKLQDAPGEFIWRYRDE